MFHKKLFDKSKNWWHSISGVMVMRAESHLTSRCHSKASVSKLTSFFSGGKIADIPNLRLTEWLNLSTIYVISRIVCHPKMHCALRIQNTKWLLG